MFATRIEATYEGTDNSMGYRKGQRYVLLVSHDTIMRTDRTGRCPYRSMEVFFWIWKDIKVLPNVFIRDEPKEL